MHPTSLYRTQEDDEMSTMFIDGFRGSPSALALGQSHHAILRIGRYPRGNCETSPVACLLHFVEVEKSPKVGRRLYHPPSSSPDLHHHHTTNTSSSDFISPTSFSPLPPAAQLPPPHRPILFTTRLLFFPSIRERPSSSLSRPTASRSNKAESLQQSRGDAPTYASIGVEILRIGI